jgi:hypothetical protein
MLECLETVGFGREVQSLNQHCEKGGDEEMAGKMGGIKERRVQEVCRGGGRGQLTGRSNTIITHKEIAFNNYQTTKA